MVSSIDRSFPEVLAPPAASRPVDGTVRVPGSKSITNRALLVAALADGESPLTPRERQVLEASADGSPVSDISARLYLSEGTVRNYLSSAIGKTGARNRAEALRVARERGWL